MAKASRGVVSSSHFCADACGIPSSLRKNTPIARPSSIGRPGPSPRQNGILPGSPGAGETMTRSRVIASTRHEDAPRKKTSPLRDS